LLRSIAGDCITTLYDTKALHAQHVLKVTQVPKLTYIGFSQGSAQAFGAFSRFPELADRVNLFVALAPASKVLPLQNPLVDVLSRTRPDVLFHMFGKKAFIPITLFWRKKLDRDFFVKVTLTREISTIRGFF
jgi:lysosomal acid lipase/cholesteryl ester hydrolase